MKIIKNKTVLTVVVVIVTITILGFSVFRSSQSEPKIESNPTPIVELIPTIDSSIKVDLTQKVAGKEVILSIENIPAETSIIEYSLSYDTEQQGMQGVIGTVKTEDKKNKYQKEITIGTCSSGRCVYHKVDGPIKLTLKFSGNYGERLFEKDYNL